MPGSEDALSPPPSATVLPNAISDGTAALKADRLKREISAWSSRENWIKILKNAEVRSGISPTKRWSNIVSADRKQSGLLTHRFDKKGLRTETRDPKKVSRVLAYTLYDGEVVTIEKDESSSLSEGCFLACAIFNRTRILNPKRNVSHNAAEDTRALLRVTRHALQRLFQRGFGLSHNGNIEYRALLELFVTCREQVGRAWGGTSPDQHGQLDEIEIPFNSVRLVVKRDDNDDVPTLVTIKPGNEP
ncbi:hypothetical protein [Marinobacter nauticus]|uniref:hypothetical protein n=1 Tax=Marinobacter nauticus TaxID=2743 RepID=UPI001C5A0F8B|nr:hypothetical protein [Marinobacter nauticus]MBW3198996.1 hypothetical protein [Marinobacter nauticus]MBY6184406.1 hypothetical protein [Marinobacter nauticus]